MRASSPVSYTHLDVYKRQGVYGAIVEMVSALKEHIENARRESENAREQSAKAQEAMTLSLIHILSDLAAQAQGLTDLIRELKKA